MASRALAALSVQPRLGGSSAPYSGRPIRATVRPVGRGRRRRSMVVRAGGPPSTNVLILAFVLPASLFIGTLVTAARVADDLDERFLREDMTAWDYAPDTCEDSTFEGVATGCGQLCRVHNKEPIKCVAFEGSNTGRRFYMCSHPNDLENCGFVDWVDGEWPEQCQNALNRLWSMYHESDNLRINEKIQNGKLVEALNEEKAKLQKNYYSLQDDVKVFMAETEKRVMEANFKKINDDKEAKLEAEVTKLNAEVARLKQAEKHDEEMRKLRRDKWEKEKEKLKDEKKKAEYMLYDLFQLADANKEKLKLIKQKVKEMEEICE